jgi:hypothetical protein
MTPLIEAEEGKNLNAKVRVGESALSTILT